MSSRKTARHRRLSGEEKDLWRHVTGDVKPLRKRNRKPRVEPPEMPADPAENPTPETAARRVARRPLPVPEAQSAPSPPPLPELRHGETAGVDKRTAGRLKKGRLPVEARMDLHGHTQAQAHRALESFILASHEAGRRCVLVITGKGRRAEEGAGVLRDKVPQWLNQPPLRTKVLSFSYATPKDGGEGALYVLLKRKR